MDHLPYPKDPTFSPPRVPYVCTESYDGGDFLTYPLRAGWPQVLPSAEYPAFGKYELSHPSDDRELEKFFQNWIFFGLLNEVLKPVGLYHEHEYIKTVDGARYVHTENLMQRLKYWGALFHGFHDSAKRDIYMHLVACMRLAQSSLMVLSQATKTDVLVEHIRHPGFSQAIKISLAAICEIIVSAADEALVPVGETHMPGAWPRIWWDLRVEQDLRREGWCPNQIAILNRDVKFFSSQYFLRAVKKTTKGSSGHRNCNGNLCEELQVKPGTYKTAHRCESGACGFIGPDRRALFGKLRHTAIPLLRIQGTSANDIKLSVTSYEAGTRYVALSHVWVDGLGNETGNQLPRCQLIRIQSLINSVRKQIPWGGETVDDRELYLWMDTLCCPVVDPQDTETVEEQRRLKRLALSQMRDVYAQATYVLVLDKGLQSYVYKDVGVVEAALRLFTSNWMYRLWTLQEAVLAKNLVVQYKDQAVDIRIIWQDARSLRLSDVSCWAIGMEIEGMCRDFRTFFQMDADNRGGADLTKVTGAIKLRRVSKGEDEPLCIASVLNLDVSSILGTDNDREQRMCALWRAMVEATFGVPQDIIFSSVRRLHTKGFRWAPASLQQSIFSHGGNLPSEASRTPAHRTTLTRNGLSVTLPAFQIRIEHPHPHLPSGLWSGDDSMGDTIHLRHPDGYWFWVQKAKTEPYPEAPRPGRPQPGEELGGPDKSLWDVLADRKRTYYLILEDPRYSPTAQSSGLQMGLIASPERTEAREEVMRSLMTVSAQRATPNDTMLWQKAYEQANIIRNIAFDPPRVEEQAYAAVMNAVNAALQDQGYASIVRNSVDANPNSSLRLVGFSTALQQLVNEGFSSAILDPETLWSAQGLLGGLIAARVMGRYAVVEETFEPSTPWCVD